MTSAAIQASPEPCVPPRTLGMMIPHQVGPKPNAQAIKQGGCEKSWFMTGCLSHGGSLKTKEDNESVLEVTQPCNIIKNLVATNLHMHVTVHEKTQFIT